MYAWKGFLQACVCLGIFWQATSVWNKTFTVASLIIILGCPDLQISNQTRRDPEAKNKPFGTNMTFSCETGYRFDSEEYYDYDSIALDCLNGGIWSYKGKTDIRIPNCKGLLYFVLINPSYT